MFDQLVSDKHSTQGQWLEATKAAGKAVRAPAIGKKGRLSMGRRSFSNATISQRRRSSDNNSNPLLTLALVALVYAAWVFSLAGGLA